MMSDSPLDWIYSGIVTIRLCKQSVYCLKRLFK